MITNIIKSTIIMLILDIIFLISISTLFKPMLYNIQGTSSILRPIPAILCYIMLVFALNYFILNSDKTNKQKVINAILLGLVINTVYETTNYTFIDKWNILVGIIDSLWGGVLFGLTTYLTLLEFSK